MKRRTVVAYAAAATVLFLAGCSSDSDDAADAAMDHDAPAAGNARQADESRDAEPNAESESRDDAGSAGVISQVVDEAVGRSIVYTIGLTITTDDVDEAAGRAASVARSAGGFVADERTSEHTATLTLRIPTDQHTDAISELQELGEVTGRNRSTEDVTQQVVDTESRISSQRESIARIRALLAEAGELSDVISIESELASREADLDALLSRQERLASLTSLATIDVTFHLAGEETEDESEQAVGFTSGLKNGWSAFTDVIAVSAAVLGAVLPFLMLAGIIGVPLWVWARRRRTGPAVQLPVPPPAA